MFILTPKIKVHSYRRATPVGDSAYVYDWRRSESDTADVCITCMIDGEQRFLKHPWIFISIKFLCVWLTAKCGLLFADKPHFGCYILSYKCVRIRYVLNDITEWCHENSIIRLVEMYYNPIRAVWKSGIAECTLVRVSQAVRQYTLLHAGTRCQDKYF